MRDRRIRGVFVALIFTLPALIVLATSITMRSLVELFVVEAIVACGLCFASWTKAHSLRPSVVNPVRVPVAAIPRRQRGSIRKVA